MLSWYTRSACHRLEASKMTLYFRFNEDNDLYDFTTASRDDLWAATRHMVRRMRHELWGYFGIAVIDGGEWPNLTLTPASGGDAGAQRAAMAQIDPRDVANWQVGRARLSAFVSGSGYAFSQVLHCTLRSRLAHGYSMIGMETRTRRAVSWICFNPFTFFYPNGRPSIRFSSERARAAYSPTLLLLHELNHYLGSNLFGRGDGTSEQGAVNDIDTAARGHRGIGLRITYEYQDRAGNFIPRGLPGRRTDIDMSGPDSDPNLPVPPGREWVIIPSESTLRSGR
jgi:hypothetical protein